jgi:hypothetical protein
VPASLVDRTRLVEDLSLFADAGVHDVRLGLDWAELQPAPGGLHGAEVELVLGAAIEARRLGLHLWLTVLDRSLPPWFLNEGGWTDARFALHHWPRFVEACGEAWGDVVGGWVPIEHPLAIANRAVPDNPRRHGEVLDTLVTAWRDAWRILRGGPPVMTSFGVEVVRPADETIQASAAARRMDQIRWRLWLDALRTGNIAIPGRADRELADLAGSCDVVGVVVRHEADVLGLLDRVADQAPERPLAVTFALPAGPDAARETAVERFLAGCTEAAASFRLERIALDPAFDPTAAPDDERGATGRGVITRDREWKDSGRRFLGREH